ncbi:MAG: PilC/PilY family type IV pilus protein [Gallionella sp.]|nr:PilC/PilY family type IV pilus protein [Gallionella sp.]
MKTIQLILAGLLVVLMGHSTTSRAADIDIYSGLGGAAGKPNVLIVFDNSANFSAAAAGTFCTINGANNTLAGTAGGIEQCAFYSVIDSLPNDVVNIGMMAYNSTNMVYKDGTDCYGTDGGCLVVPLTQMSAANKTILKNWVATWTTSGGAGPGYIKSAGKANAAAMQEAWAYYAGSTGLSGRDYSSIKPAAGCQQNFVIFIGNSFGASGSPGDGGSASPATNLASAPGVTAAQTALITTTHVTSCGTFTFPGTASTHENGGYGADEWARYMRQSDLYSDLTETQKITTYTVGLLDASCQAEYAATLTSMASVGGGKYFATTDYDSIKQALLKILNEVQAVNSVFSSSSLPVSVNAQGTYLNQIYMGMFRPDSGGYPRWVGNLKQYQFIYDPVADSLTMGDSLGVSAISASGTGFISPNAVSYWTCGGASGYADYRACSPVADPTNGFWANNSQGAGGAYDLPDGELVEKGGAAQIMRLANLTDVYTDAAGYPSTTYSTNPRQLYTHCPSGLAIGSCKAQLRDSTNIFATSNGNIQAIDFGASSTLNVTSIDRTGTTALVTTSGTHGYSDGSSVTISGAAQTEYNVTQAISYANPHNATTFTITGLPNKPTTPSVGAYTVSLHNAAAQAITSISRNETATNSATATVTTTAAAHGYNNGDSVIITGATPSDYNGTKTISTSGPLSNQFTYSVPVYPTTPALNSYKAVVHPYSRTILSITKVSNDGLVTTSAPHGFHVGQSVTIAGTGEATYDGTKTVTVVGTTTTFKFSGVTGNPGAITAGATVIPSTTAVALGGVGSMTRTGTTAAATATATGATASAFANGDTLDITVNTGANANESAYVVSGALITCSGTCTTFTYPITTTPALSASGTMEVALSVGSVNIPAGSITRSGSGTTATVTGVVNGFASGNSVDISTSGAVYADESAYTGTWTITCAALGCNPFTFGPVTLSPATPATPTGAHITVYQGDTPPAKDPLINWVRGQDNFGDELGPGSGVTVRPSFHGDVLHSRPVVVNYSGTIGVIVYYGANDGVFRAVNGNQTAAISYVTGGVSVSVPPGGELWGFIPTDFFGKLNRQRTNSPQLDLPTTPDGILPAPEPKDYFADGSTGIYQLMDADGTTLKAYLYLAMRRGGRLIYALDVSTPTDPKFLWKIDPTGLTVGSTDSSTFTASVDFAELGETWSAPKVASVEGYANPVLIFGGGYDTAEDSEPPTDNTMGRGIFIVDAITGALVWSATPGVSACSGTTTKATCLVSGMDYSIPADITLVDRDGNGKIDRLYAVDVGGNVWRVDIQPTAAHKTPNYWQVNKLAALGCPNGVVTTDGTCSVGPPRVTPGKFFYPADVVTTSSYDAVLVGQGDREHPLYTQASYAITNRFYMLKDVNTDDDGSGATLITPTKLFDATSATYGTALPSTGDSTTPNLGYYVTLDTGEKVVNAPLTVAGYTYFGTNQPVAPDANSCSTNLGIARGYKIKQPGGAYTYSTFSGGGLPPSPVAGLVNVNVTVNGVTTTKLVPFVIGGGGDPDCVGADCSSALGGGKPTISVPTSRTRTYWYQEID